MTARAIMIQGTGSDVGKSLIVAGLARAFANRGLKVAPFKPQNMSNNAAVTADGGEIGRAQALQARAARVPASVHMNPLLLKPESATGSQVILQGHRVATLKARDFAHRRVAYLPAVLDSFRQVAAAADLVLVEGAGSPAEINLRHGDIANMGFAAAADLPVVLVGDVHRGGVIAAVAGTFAILDPADAARLKGFIINNFHGDPDLFSEATHFLEKRTNTPCLGIVPHFPDAGRLPAEDAVALERPARGTSGPFRIAVARLGRIANFDDLDPLKLEPGVSVEMVQPGKVIPAEADLVILPGSKSTIADLAFLRAQGWDIDIAAHVRRGGHVLGLCGGFQMLGRMIYDPGGIEGQAGSASGLGLLDVETVLEPTKTLANVEAIHCATNLPISGYEIHLGRTTGPDCARPFATIAGRPDGATAPGGRVMGTYLHGCFAGDAFRHAFLEGLGAAASGLAFEEVIDATLDGLATHLEHHLDLDRILALAMPTG
jgi:adenosylcobyric acid synthase